MAGFSPSSKSPTGGGAGPVGWYYEIDGTVHGPVEFRALRALALERKILAHHLVWKEGNDDKVEASAILGLIPPPKGRPAAHARPTDSNDPYASPSSGTIADGPPGGLYLPHLHPANFPLYLASLAIAIALTGWVAFFAENLNSVQGVASVLSLAAISLLTWLTLSLVYLHRAWTMMRTFGASLSGGKAVRFLLVPFFNALWCFVALYGWAKFWNYNVRHHPGLRPAQPVWHAFFFIFPILFLVSQGLLLMHLLIQEWPTDLTELPHLISLGTWVASLLVGLVCWGQMAQSINFLARKKS